LRQGGLFQEAIENHKKAIVLNPKNSFAHYYLGLALESKGQLKVAIESYKKAIDLDPEISPAVYFAARATILVAAGAEKGTGNLDPQERMGLRMQALDWIKSTVHQASEKLDRGDLKPDALIGKWLPQYKENKGFASVRDFEQLAQLPPEEQELWHQLWSDVERLGQRAVHKLQGTKQAAAQIPR
jgi:tetratricopeptide (TPR) repeat protein